MRFTLVCIELNMKGSNRRNHLSISYKVSRVSWESMDSQKDTGGFSTRVVNRSLRLTGLITQTKFYHRDHREFSRRRHCKGSSKLKAELQS